MSKRYEELGGTEIQRLFYSFAHMTVYGLGKALFRLKIEGAESVPQSGRAIIACWHLDSSDVLFVPAAVPERHVTVVGRRGVMESPVTGWLFKQWGAVTIDRPAKGESARRDTIDIIEQPLHEDRLLLLFNNGHRMPGWKPGQSKRGVAKFAQDTEADIYPAVVKGSDRLKERQVTVKFGSRLDHPTHRREHRDLMEQIAASQRELWDTIPHSHHYKDPQEFPEEFLKQLEFDNDD